jgi:hypothetical protein
MSNLNLILNSQNSSDVIIPREYLELAQFRKLLLQQNNSKNVTLKQQQSYPQQGQRLPQQRNRYIKKQILLTSECLRMPMADVASIIGVTNTTLYNYWRKTYPNRRWPNKIIRRLENEISLIKRRHALGYSTKNNLETLTEVLEDNLKPATIEMRFLKKQKHE